MYVGGSDAAPPDIPTGYPPGRGTSMAPAKPALDACRRYARLINLLRAAGGARARGRGLGPVAVAVIVRVVVGEGQRGLGLELQLEAGAALLPALLVLPLLLLQRSEEHTSELQSHAN